MEEGKRGLKLRNESQIKQENVTKFVTVFGLEELNSAKACDKI